MIVKQKSRRTTTNKNNLKLSKMANNKSIKLDNKDKRTNNQETEYKFR